MVNCFQPSLKLQAKISNGDRVRRVYDVARTLLQRLLASGMLSETRQQELSMRVQQIDPLALSEHLDALRYALIALAQRCGWEIGYMDEVWWSRLSQPNLHSWSEQDRPLRLQEINKEKDDPDPKALACYGMLSSSNEHMFLRFVAGRPVSSVTIEFLQWLCAQGHHVLVLIWDNASWHVSKQMKSWLREHNQAVPQETGSGKAGVRIIPCWLPVKSP